MDRKSSLVAVMRRRTAVIQRIVRFGCVGVVGFIVDASTLLLLVRFFALPPISARLISFLSAATVTFALNQRFTFRIADAFSMHRWVIYVLTTAFGAGVNLGVYSLWIHRNGTTPVQLALGTAVGSLVAMALNFAISSTLVFRTSRESSSLL